MNLTSTSHHAQKLKMDQRPKSERYTTNVLEKIIEEHLQDLEIGKYFLNWKRRRVSHKKKSKPLRMRFKMSALWKTPFKKWKGKPQTGKKWLQYMYQTNDLYLESIKKYQSILKRQTTLIFLNGNKGFDQVFYESKMYGHDHKKKFNVLG